MHPDEQPNPDNDDAKFHGWRLLGFLLLVVLFIAGVSALIDWLALGPLEGRVY